MLKVSLYRYNPETDEAPYMQDFSVDTGGRSHGARRAGVD